MRPVGMETTVAPTVLPQYQTVSALGGGSSTSTDPQLAQNGNPPAQNQPAQFQAQLTADQTTRVVVLNPETREVIFRVIDSRSRQVLRQVPDEALLRMRAYNKALEEGKSPADVLTHADMQV
ncbi:flagellar protein FlaG [Rhodoplanes roseus]|nr:flagellar protein FlaG [Rhodoplanes roseus]